GRGRPEPAQRHVWPVRSARVAGEGAPQQLLLEARQSAGLAPAVEKQQGVAGAGRRAGARLSGTTIITKCLRAAVRLPLWLERQGRRLVAGAGRGVLRSLRRGAGENRGQTTRGARRALAGPGGRRNRLL